MASQVDKRLVLDAARARLQADLNVVIASQKNTQASAVHPEAKQENSKDTRAIEAGYLARGLAIRVEAQKSAVATMRRLVLRQFDHDTPVGLSALVTLSEEASSRTQVCFLAPVGGGLKVAVAGFAVQLVTPQSPLGQGLMGRLVDDEVVISTPGGRVYWLIEHVE